jgi:hypothetical protein
MTSDFDECIETLISTGKQGKFGYIANHRNLEDISPNCRKLAFFGKQEGNFPILEVIFRRRFFLMWPTH